MEIGEKKEFRNCTISHFVSGYNVVHNLSGKNLLVVHLAGAFRAAELLDFQSRVYEAVGLDDIVSEY